MKMRVPVRRGGWRRFPAGLALVLLALGLGTPVRADGGGDFAFVTASLADGVKGEPYMDTSVDPPVPFIFETCDGATPISFRVISGTMPAGMSVTIDGELQGAPAACGTFAFELQAVEGNGDFANRVFTLVVGGPPAVALGAGTLSASVEAGAATIVDLPLTNQGCDSYRFATQITDLGPAIPSSAEESLWSVLMGTGASLPPTIGSVSGPAPLAPEGWSVQDGLLVDGEGNVGTLERRRHPASEISQGPVARSAGISVLYVNESAVTGEKQRLIDAGCTVVESRVPQALDLDTLRAFDVLWLTAATASAAPARDVINQYLWEGGGLILTQVQASGTTTLLPPGYEIGAFVGPPLGNDNHTIAFTAAAPGDPLTAVLDITDLPSNFDSTVVADSGPRWTFLAVQEDLPEVGTLATAELGEGRIVYNSGNLGTSAIPGARTGTEVFLTQMVDRAGGGGFQESCPWLTFDAATSDLRTDAQNVADVPGFDVDGETVTLHLDADARGVLPGTYDCRIHLLTDVPDDLERSVVVTLTVTDPAEPTILSDELPPADPGVPYGGTLPLAGGTSPYVVTLVGGTLPVGLMLNPDGSLFGTPTEAGVFDLTFRVTDDLGAFTERAVRLVSGLAITTETLPDSIVAAFYGAAIHVRGGTPPYRFELEPGVDFSLPATDPMSPEGMACVTTDLGGGMMSTQCALDTGVYRLVFEDLTGFAEPFDVDVEVTDTGMVAVNADFLELGTITVTTDQPLATWGMNGVTPLGNVEILGDGELTTVTGVIPGDYTIGFNSILGFATPANQMGTLAEGGSLSFDATYVSVVPPPPAARPAPALPAASGAGSVSVRHLPDDASMVTRGFAQGSLMITTDAPGARVRVVGKRLPSLLEFFEPCGGPDPAQCDPRGGVGASAALSGLMATVESPLLVGGQRVPLSVVVEDAEGSRIRRTYAPMLFDGVSLAGIAPGTAAQGLELDMDIFGANLNDSAVISLGPDITVVPGMLVSTGFDTALRVEVTVDPAAVADDRDLIYTDPDLVGSPGGNTIRVRDVFQIFVEVSRMDLDGTGRLDGFDLARIARGFGLSSGDPGFDPPTDVDGDGDTDGQDVASFAISFGRSVLEFVPATLIIPDATVGQSFEHRVAFTGGNVFLNARTLSGALPDGLTLGLDPGVDPPTDSELLISGIPAETGTFNIRVQVTDAFFAIRVADLSVTVQPAP